MAPNGAGNVFFRLIQTLPTFWAERILILRIFIFGIFLDPKFPDFQVPDFQISRNLAWAQLGPSLGPAWAPRVGRRTVRGTVRGTSATPPRHLRGTSGPQGW